MNIEINLLPEELLPKPPVESRTLLTGVLVVALVACCVFFFQAKGSANGEIADLEASIASVSKQIETVSSNSQAVALRQSIDKLKTATKDYASFVESRVLWGRALAEVEDYLPQGASLSSLAEKAGNTLQLTGTASDYAVVDSYFSVLDRDDSFSAPVGPTFTGSTFTLLVQVAAGGGQ